MSLPTARVLFVCTANQCRSPFAAALATRSAGDLPIEFESAGVETWSRPVPDEGVAHGDELGLDLRAHVSRPLPVGFLDDYDVLLGLERRHVRDLLAVAPEAAPRIFTLKQFARWLRDHPRPPRAEIGPWLDAVAADRPTTDLLGSDPADDVADPYRLPIEQWRLMTADVAPAVESVLDGLFPRERRASASAQ